MRKGRYTGHEQALPEEVTLIAVGPINKGRTPELAHGGRAASQLVLPHGQPKTRSRRSLDFVKNASLVRQLYCRTSLASGAAVQLLPQRG